MRKQITNWAELTPKEQDGLTAAMGDSAMTRFDTWYHQNGRDSLINIYHLMTNEKVAGDLWQYVRDIAWAECNQIGIEASDTEAMRLQIEASGNFRADGIVTLTFKKSVWSLRQIQYDDNPLDHHGMQIYRPDDNAKPNLLVADIDTVVFSSLASFPSHALDILRPDATLNDPLVVREALWTRGIFPNDETV